MLAALLFSLALGHAATPPAPVGDQPWLRWQRAMSDTMSGPRASPWYRDTASTLDVYWRLLAVDPDTLALDPVWAQRALDLSLAGAASALERVLRETLDRSEELATISRIAGTVASPSLRISRGEQGLHLSVEEPEPGARPGLAAVRAPPGLNRPRSPSVRFGSGFRLSALDEEDDDPRPALGAWVAFDRVALDAMMLQVLLPAPDWAPGSELSPVAPRWSLALREQLRWGWTVNGDLSSDQQLGLPARARLGLGLRIPGCWRCFASAGLSHPLWREGQWDDAGLWRGDLTLRTELRWHLPVDVDRWPLGLEPGARGPVLPRFPARGPTQVGPIPWGGSGPQLAQGGVGVEGDVGVGAAPQP